MVAVSKQHWAVIAASVGVLALIGVGLTAVRHSEAPPSITNIAVATTPPPVELSEHRSWSGTITTSAGDIGVELYGDRAPQAVAAFVGLAREGFFNDTPCHRLTTEGIFVLQCGDPTGSGTGGPGFSFGPIENAPANNMYPAGTLAMARRGGDGNSMGSQFFFVYADSQIPADNAGGYTVFGRITSGMDILQAIAAEGAAGGLPDGRPAVNVTIQGVEVQ